MSVVCPMLAFKFIGKEKNIDRKVKSVTYNTGYPIWSNAQRSFSVKML